LESWKDAIVDRVVVARGRGGTRTACRVRSIVDAGAEDFAVPLGAGWSRNVRMPGQVVSVAGFHDREAQGRGETCRRAGPGRAGALGRSGEFLSARLHQLACRILLDIEDKAYSPGPPTCVARPRRPQTFATLRYGT
jgi:hypothetical protein